ncbi:MAG: single-stranded-DNA-specific exonuclease RecJ [Alphaproteobacteria bacterium]|nr:single-stranded-DNA-specific exonuclease RecJ [Alphaproteobacteria bacterium]
MDGIAVQPSADALLGVECSIGGQRWRLRQSNAAEGMTISQQLGLPEIVGRLLGQRGVGSGQAALFLEPRLRDQLPDPAHLRDMDKAAARLVRAIRDGETIAVFGDYDVDGATSAALLLRFLAAVGGHARLYVPDRLREGYGPNLPALLKLKEEGARLVVTVDCGTTAHEPISAAAAAGLDAIVIDHHVAEPLLPRAIAVVNPNRLDETSPHGTLAAVGLAFLLVVATNRALRAGGWYQNGRGEPDLLQWLDLVALGTVCDVVPLSGLNRAFVAQGIKVARRGGNIGLKALAAAAGASGAADAHQLGFVLGPRVNAGGRIGAADLGARLLATEDAALAAELAQRLDGYNRERREIEAHTLESAIAAIEAAPQAPVLAFAVGEGWHPGVIGIVAARLKERYQRPACVVAVDNGIGRGSGRSIPGLPLGPAVIAARQAGLLVNGGGHAMAAGFTVQADNIEALRAFLVERLGDGLDSVRLVPELTIDGALSAAGAGTGLIDHIAALAPFGAGNPEPRFVLPAVRVAYAEMVGSGHLRCILADPLGPARLQAIAFRAAGTVLGRFLAETRGAAVHVAGRLRRDDWRGGDAVQLCIDDAAPGFSRDPLS